VTSKLHKVQNKHERYPQISTKAEKLQSTDY